MGGGSSSARAGNVVIVEEKQLEVAKPAPAVQKETPDHQDGTGYVPADVWSPKPATGQWASVNSHTSGARQSQHLPVGRHKIQLYSMGTPNGVKATIMLEELGIDYDGWLVKIDGEQFGSGFVGINPNSKIPALMDYSGEQPQRVFESGSILMYLAEKYGKFLPTSGAARVECISWLMWQMGSAPYVGGGFGHFYAYAPFKQEYPIDRFTMEAKRQLDVLDKHLADKKYMIGDEYTIADMAIWPWYGNLVLGRLYDAAEFLAVHEYQNVMRWAKEINERPAVKRGRMVNRTWGPQSEQVPERHSRADFEGKAC
eukprot:TRINITY_DN1072_c0_g1_i1.p1 TRINITY_DN1072_c0_g1~~TRINITY_DN1072_c0_g1_i1.p1  ORF type:complete len:313 (+),score=112.60 TRINITY_DN1072_c0_g1_i1:620-1558(+)